MGHRSRNHQHSCEMWDIDALQTNATVPQTHAKPLAAREGASRFSLRPSSKDVSRLIHKQPQTSSLWDHTFLSYLLARERRTPKLHVCSSKELCECVWDARMQTCLSKQASRPARFYPRPAKMPNTFQDIELDGLGSDHRLDVCCGRSCCEIAANML